MRVFLIRHAEAVDRTGSMPDAARHLTTRGRLSSREVARRLRDEGLRPSRILTSPLLRAVQTADILAEHLGFGGEVIPAPQLGPGFDLDGMNEILDAFPEETDLALIGHEPDLGRLLCQLLSLSVRYGMPKGAVAALVLPDAGTRRNATLEWLLAGDRRFTDPSDLTAAPG
ncbi:MAG: phosphohistidine phosphatase SixA [Verrucomicrobiota bacterium]